VKFCGIVFDLVVLITYLLNELKHYLKQSIMKKVLLALAVIATLSLTSCKKQVKLNETTEVAVDSTVVDSVSVDTTVVDTTKVK
jgi:hypothetical protein